MSGYTQNELIRYYVVKTESVCLHCCKTSSVSVSQKIMVEYLDGNGKPASISLNALIDRYVKLHEYRISAEDAFARLPQLPFETKTFEETINFCQDCLPLDFGSDADNAFPVLLPAPQKLKLESVESENIDIHNGGQERKRKKPTSRKIKRETEEERKKRETLQAIRRGDLSSLL